MHVTRRLTRRDRVAATATLAAAVVALALLFTGINAAPTGSTASAAPSSSPAGDGPGANAASGTDSSAGAEDSAASTTYPAPTVAVGQPIPTAPDPNPPAGRAPDGSVVGGDGLASRGAIFQPSATPFPATVSAHAWMVADIDTGTVVGAQDPHGRYYPASTLKTLTFLSLFNKLDLTQQVPATTEDENIEGSRVGIVNGGVYTVEQLYLGMMLQSGNDAANALARTYGGIPKTLDLMNETADSLSAYDTVAGTPAGLDIQGQSTSPYDLCLFMREIIRNPKMLQIASTTLAGYPPVPPNYPGFGFDNQNQLLYMYDGALAGKSGFTDAAQHTYVGAAKQGGRTMIVSLMLADASAASIYQQAAALLDWGFAQPPSSTGVGTLPPLPEVAAASSSAAAATSKAQAAAAAKSSSEAAAAASEAAAEERGSGGPIVPIVIGAGVLAITGFGLRWEYSRRKAARGDT